jgi:hypothetical protein
MLGTNDAFSFSWSGAKAHFVADYKELLDTYTSLASKPKPYMIIPGLAIRRRRNCGHA